jgi:alpha-L-fucosidase
MKKKQAVLIYQLSEDPIGSIHHFRHKHIKYGIRVLLCSVFMAILFQSEVVGQTSYTVTICPGKTPVAKGKFEATWESLSQYEIPEWFRNAKFDIWVHRGPQCEPEEGD